MVRPVGAYADEPDRYLVARRIHAKQFGSCKGRGYSRYQGGLNKGTTSEGDLFHNDSGWIDWKTLFWRSEQAPWSAA